MRLTLPFRLPQRSRKLPLPKALADTVNPFKHLIGAPTYIVRAGFPDWGSFQDTER